MRIYISVCAAVVVMIGFSATVAADELTMMVEQDLAKLGYETGPVDGEETTETIIAISKFQAENGLEVDGEVSQKLARALIVAQSNPSSQPSATATVPATSTQSSPEPTRDAATLQAAQNACLQEKMAAAQKSQKIKRGFGRLMRAVTRHATGSEISQTASDIYRANATAEDLSAAAKDLGLTEDDIAECQNP